MAAAGFDPTTFTYVDGRVTRGFPMGGIGSGGFSFNSDGSFSEVRFNNNWMCPVGDLRGSFHALFVRCRGEAQTVVLRRASNDWPYEGQRHVRSTSFAGTLPSFTLRYADDLPLRLTLHGFTPHVPHDVRSSTLPAAVFRFTLESTADDVLEAAILFSFDNVLGRGGTGHRGVDLGPEQEMRGIRPRIVYDSVAGNHQEEARLEGARGVRFRTDQRHDPRSHRNSVTGEYLLLAECQPGLEITVCDGWNAASPRATVLDDFSTRGRLVSRASGRCSEEPGYRPAAAVAAACELAPGESREIAFTLAWWTADHVTEPGLIRHADGAEAPHDGIRIGHVYENHFRSIDAVAAHVTASRRELESASSEVNRMLEWSSLPRWLVRAVQNSIDSTLCNTVVPANGRMYTLEGVDWHWPMGGLTGTNDQRLSAHPYTATFFTELDLSELDEFRRLADARGAIPHGNGNCDLGLGTTDVPYGWPMFIKDFLPAKEWTDLTMSLVLQVARHWRTSGRRDLLERFWPALVRGMEYLHALAPHGIPEGGTTYDVWDFPGSFIYTATLYLASLRAMIDMAAHIDPQPVGAYRERYARCVARMDGSLWDERGFFRTCETKDTIFTAALAGDWAARYAGLEPVVDPARAASHMRHQHRVLIEAAIAAAGDRYRALPRAEASFDGTLIVHPMAGGLPAGEEMTYVWQVLSYQAMEQIYLGQVEQGLQTMRCIYERLWHDGNAWSGGLRGNGESVYMTHPAIWAALNALTGAALDVPSGTLHLSPRTGGEIAYLRCPFFFPSFWATLEHDPTSGQTSVEVHRSFGEPITIERVQQRTATGTVRQWEVGRVEVRQGAAFALNL